MKKYQLIEIDHGNEKTLKIGDLKEITEYLKKNEELITWVLDEDPNIELPNLANIETLRDLVAELEKINLSWWELKIEETEEEEMLFKSKNLKGKQEELKEMAYLEHLEETEKVDVSDLNMNEVESLQKVLISLNYQTEYENDYLILLNADELRELRIK